MDLTGSTRAEVRDRREYQRGVVFRLGRLQGVRDPGIRFMIPLVDRMWKVTLRTVTMPIPSQQVITRDNVSIARSRLPDSARRPPSSTPECLPRAAPPPPPQAWVVQPTPRAGPFGP
ncbi:SPFH domain-containing protein [Streptomyces sp. RB6PN25]|uniref:SPFH domain-containing protein n=1 Tax=Streptomyces humicola TaxID=2953240 RepID=A0ABT1Q1V1_9ACTN|nr:SPFH domain-containing protein [Streptomyces humicola]MCQ4083908.1 SPFH domain-containing protein [Streptomyces humicola]